MKQLVIWPLAVLLLVIVAIAALAAAVVPSAGNAQGWCQTPTSTPAPADNPVAGLDHEQTTHAATIITVGHNRTVPPRGWVIAIATALQESGLRNLNHGDRDSLGLFQQRPSQGWGTAEQIMDPTYAAEAFYDKLLQIDDWQNMPLTQAAQAVQQSAYPDAYAQHEQQATRIVNTLTGTDCAMVTATGWTRPLDGEVVSGFRTTNRPTHYGIDIPAPHGTTIRAAAAGTVTVATCQATRNDQPHTCDVDGSPQVSGCGWYLDILHPGGILTRYCHLLQRPEVRIGDQVTAGQPIGLVGSSGHSSGAHLHLEVETRTIVNRSNNRVTVERRQVDPIRFFAARGIIHECAHGNNCQPAHGDRVRVEHRTR